MKISPEKLRDLGNDLDRVRENYKDVVEDDPQIQRQFDATRDYVKAKYARISEPRPTEGKNL